METTSSTVLPLYMSCIHLLLRSPNPHTPRQVGDAEQRQLDELKQLRQLAFVITDLEHSTAIASGAPKSFEKVQARGCGKEKGHGMKRMRVSGPAPWVGLSVANLRLSC